MGVFPFTNQKRDRQEFTLFVRFLVSDVYLGTLHLPEDDVYDELCPICGEDLNRRHILTECKGLEMERRILCSKIPAYRLSDLGWLARFRERPVSQFLKMVNARFVAVGHMEICSTATSVISPVE